MSYDIRTNHRTILRAESHLHRYRRGGELAVCLVSASRYRTGMSSLGFQTIYGILAGTDGIRCERAFFPEREAEEEYRRSGTPLLSLETSTPLADFDVIAFSTSFEPDYLNIPLMLRYGRIPLHAAERNHCHPLIIAGGAAFFINPEPVADFIDAICIGEGEAAVPAILETLLSPVDNGRQGLLEALARIPGLYIPAFYTPEYQDALFTGHRGIDGAPLPLAPEPVRLEQYEPAASRILTDQTEFGDMFLIEVSRGCPRGCRFCSSGFIYGAFRQQPLEHLLPLINEGLTHRNKIGLVGAAVSDYTGIGKLCSHIVASGGKVSVSSLRIDRLDEEMLTALIASGHKTISIAPEGGSQRMRDIIRKNLTEAQILEACGRLIGHDILNIRLYFIIGLPGENDADLEEMVLLIEKIRLLVIERARSNKRLGEITVSVNPFIPKPFTPFQWCGMEPLQRLEGKVKILENRLRRLSNVKLKVESLRESYLQALLSRGDRRLTPLLVAMSEGANLKKAAKQCALDTDYLVQREIAATEALPWGIIGTAECGALRREYERAMASAGENQ